MDRLQREVDYKVSQEHLLTWEHSPMTKGSMLYQPTIAANNRRVSVTFHNKHSVLTLLRFGRYSLGVAEPAQSCGQICNSCLSYSLDQWLFKARSSRNQGQEFKRPAHVYIKISVI